VPFHVVGEAKPVVLNFGDPGRLDITPWSERVLLVNAGALSILDQVSQETYLTNGLP
jgi:3-(3-hydroxy-phenyl)propionate hydroxylase